MQSLLSLGAFLTMVAGLVGAFYSGTLFWRAPVVIAVQLAAFALMIWARITFGRRSFHATASPTSGGIVKTGPYRFVRHPIYTAAILFVLPGAFMARTPRAFALAAVVIAGAVVRMLCEESLLIRQYPEYAEYARTTSRIIPGVF